MEGPSGKQNSTETVPGQSCEQGAIYVGEDWVKGTAGDSEALESLYPVNTHTHQT